MDPSIDPRCRFHGLQNGPRRVDPSRIMLGSIQLSHINWHLSTLLAYNPLCPLQSSSSPSERSNRGVHSWQVSNLLSLLPVMHVPALIPSVQPCFAPRLSACSCGWIGSTLWRMLRWPGPEREQVKCTWHLENTFNFSLFSSQAFPCCRPHNNKAVTYDQYL